jgi:hypothetical protein
MPAGREKVVNKALSGAELRKVIDQDWQALLDNHGLLSSMIAFGRVGYDIILKLHVDNAQRPDGDISKTSRAIARNVVAEQPELAAVETAPLVDPSPDAFVDATRLHRNIDSPNAERVRVGIPVPVQRRQDDGTLITEEIKYPASDEGGAGDVTTEDLSAVAEKDWNAVR